jgi:hypothetical protein
LTEARIAQLAEAKKKQAIVLDHSQANERKLGKCGIGPLDHVASAVQIRAEAEHVFSVSSRGDVRKFVAHEPGLQIRGLNRDPASVNPWLCPTRLELGGHFVTARPHHPPEES